MQIDKDSILGDIIDADPSCAEVFARFGMDCLDCPAAWGETLAEACEIHGVSIQELIAQLHVHRQNKE